MDLTDFHFLLSPPGQKLLAAIGEEGLTEANHLALATRLRQEVEPRQAQAVLETVLLRQKGATKFSRAAQMYFTRPALEQASGEVISHYRAERYRRLGFERVADLGCGIGGDTLALTTVGQVVGLDKDPVRLAMAGENVAVYGRGERFEPVQADLRELRPLAVEALFADPGRRDEYGRRLHSVHHYRPPLSLFDDWRGQVPHQGIKISPGVDYTELPPEAEVEFISVEGGVREGVLWFGDLASGVRRRATLLPGGATLTSEMPRATEVGSIGAYLYEPDGAVIRAHLVEQLAHQLGAHKIEDTIAYLTAEQGQETPLATCYQIEDHFPFQLKRLRHYLRARNVGRAVIKKRGSPLDPDALRHKLRLQGSEQCTIFLTLREGQPLVLVGRPWQPATFPD